AEDVVDGAPDRDERDRPAVERIPRLVFGPLGRVVLAHVPERDVRIEVGVDAAGTRLHAELEPDLPELVREHVEERRAATTPSDDESRSRPRRRELPRSCDRFGCRVLRLERHDRLAREPWPRARERRVVEREHDRLAGRRVGARRGARAAARGERAIAARSSPARVESPVRAASATTSGKAAARPETAPAAPAARPSPTSASAPTKTSRPSSRYGATFANGASLTFSPARF